MEERRFVDGKLEVVVLPDIGARLHRIRAYGYDILRTPVDPESYGREPFFWGSYVMAPWCNRIETSPIDIGPRTMRLQPNFPDGTAIHGQVYSRRWEETSDGLFRIQAGGDDWPWEYVASLQVEVAEPTVRLTYALTNLSPDAMPAGLGIHPLFRKPVRIAINGKSVFSPNTDTPAMPSPVEGPLDLREIGEVAENLDASWTDLSDPAVQMMWPDSGIRASMRATGPAVYLSVASLSFLDSVAVEPETNLPQGLRRLLNREPGGLQMLASGATLSLNVELTLEQGA